MKQCRKCGSEKPRAEFHKNRNEKDGLHRWCKSCDRVKRRRIHLQNTYGLTTQAWDTMLATQDSRCACCSHSFTGKPQVDHSHATGAVRKLLCGKCNRMLGLANDNPTILRAAVAYLEQHQ